MSFIYGLISNYTNNPKSNIIKQLIEVIQWESSIHIQIEETNLSAGILYDKSLPYRKEDFFYYDKNNNTIILLSGVIYNQIELIEKTGIEFKNKFLPELILGYYLKYGENFVSELNGDFAILIYNTRINEARLYRDHVGVKPISYCVLNDCLLFSSDFLALSKVLSTTETLNELYLFQNLTRSNLWDYSLTPCKKVIKVIPGHYIKYSNIGLKQIKYWFPEKIRVDNKLDIKKAISEIGEILSDAVKIRCDHRFFASAHVSGGLDSGLIAALAKKEYTHQNIFYGFSWSAQNVSNIEIDIDERDLAREICEFNGIELKLSKISKSDFIDYVSNWMCRVGYFDEFKIRKDAKNLGANLIFSGHGGDEFLSCHELGIDSDLLFNLKWISFFEKNSIFKPKIFISNFLHGVFFPFFGIARFQKSTDETKHYRKYLNLDNIRKGKSKYNLSKWRSRKDVHLGYLYNYHLVSRMEEWANCGNNMGIEYRYPLLDKRIVEYSIKIPSNLIYQDSRLIMKNLCKNMLPEKVIGYTKLSDDVHSIKFEEIVQDSFDILLNNYEIYKRNPYLSFIDFDLLMNDIIEYKKKPRVGELPNNLRILFLINNIQVITSNFIN